MDSLIYAIACDHDAAREFLKLREYFDLSESLERIGECSEVLLELIKGDN